MTKISQKNIIQILRGFYLVVYDSSDWVIVRRILSKSLSSQCWIDRNWILFDCLIIGPITVDVIHLNHSSKIRFREPHFVRSSEVTDRPWIRIYPEELTLNLGKKEKKRVGFGFWSTDGLPREKKKENYQKDKKGLCFKLSYIFTFKSYWQVMIWKNIENDFWKLRVQKFMFY